MRSERPRVVGSPASMTDVSARTVSSRDCTVSMIVSRGSGSARRPASAWGPFRDVFGPSAIALDPHSNDRSRRVPGTASGWARTPTNRRDSLGIFKIAPATSDDRDIMSTGNSREFHRKDVPFLTGEDAFEPTVLAWRPASQWSDVEGQVVRSDARVAELMLGLVRETSAARNDEQRLLDVIASFAFKAFPNATHHVL